ncbi:MAG: hypothetical protein ACI4B5_08130 [Bacteroidaceae bacterium]
MGRNKFSAQEIKEIKGLLRRKNSTKRYGQKMIRHVLRVDYEFNISDFNEPGKAFGENELDAAVERGAILILDDATIANMKAKRARDRACDEAIRLEANPISEEADWKKAMEEWQRWENSVSDTPITQEK